MSKPSLILSGFLLLINCDRIGRIDQVYMDYNHQQIPYQLYKPDGIYSLHPDLQEISGLSMDENGQLAAVEDENGLLYVLNPNNGEVIRRLHFANEGDYEGIEVINGTTHALLSDGTLFTFEVSGQEKPAADVTDTPFSSKNNVEGLGYDGSHLLIACKGQGDIEGNEVSGKAIYFYSVLHGKIDQNAVITLRKEDLLDHIRDNQHFNQLDEFNPSAIAVHPLTSDLYVLSADGILIVLTPDHHIKEVARLDERLYPQAEGICFSSTGTLFIASEGADAGGQVLKFMPLPKGNSGPN